MIDKPVPRIRTKTPFLLLPDIDLAARHLTEWWALAGFAKDQKALSWQELESFARITQHRVTAWEAKTLIRMSREYVWMLGEGRSKGCPPPYAPQILANRLRKQAEKKAKLLKPHK